MNTKISTTLTWIAVGSLALAASACSSGSAVSSDGTSEGGMVQVIEAVPTAAVLGISEGYSREATRLGLDLKVSQSSGDPTKDLANVQDAISKGAQGLLMIPLNIDAVRPALRQAVDNGICVGIAYSNVTEQNPITPGVKTYFGYSDDEGGRNLVDSMAEEMNGKGGIVFIGGTATDPGSQTRLAAVQDQLASKYPGIELLASQSADYDPAKARSTMQDFVQRYGDRITGVITAADSMSETVADYLSTGPLAGNVLVGSFGGQQSFVDDIKAGTAFATVPLPVVDDGSRAMQRISECIKGDKSTVFDSSTTQESMQPLADSGYVITRANVDTYTPQY